MVFLDDVFYKFDYNNYHYMNIINHYMNQLFIDYHINLLIILEYKILYIKTVITFISKV